MLFYQETQQDVKKIAQLFDNPKKLSSNREYTLYTGYLNGVQVGVCSTGIGGPSAAIALERACGMWCRYLY